MKNELMTAGKMSSWQQGNWEVTLPSLPECWVGLFVFVFISLETFGNRWHLYYQSNLTEMINVLKNYCKPRTEWTKINCAALGSWGSAISDEEVFHTVITADHNSTSIGFQGSLSSFSEDAFCFKFFEAVCSQAGHLLHFHSNAVLMIS